MRWLRKFIRWPPTPLLQSEESAFIAILHPSRKELLKFVQELGGAKDQRELMNTALTLFLWAVDARIRQYDIAKLDRVTQSLNVLEMDFLDRCAKAALERGLTRLPPVPY